MVESPDLFRNVANQSLNGGKQGTPLRSTNLKKLVPSRPQSA
jgi:hypothetical protein